MPLRKAKAGSEPRPQPKDDTQTPAAIEPIIERYGDLLYDLCESILW